MRRSLILGLLILVAVAGIVASWDPEQSGRLAQMYSDMALTGETRDIVVAGLAVVIGGFIVYLTVTRR